MALALNLFGFHWAFSGMFYTQKSIDTDFNGWVRSSK